MHVRNVEHAHQGVLRISPSLNFLRRCTTNFTNIKEDIEKEFSIVAYRGGERVIALKGKGVSPLMEFIVHNENNLSQYENLLWGDRVVGRASAMLLVKFKAKAIYGKIVSTSAKAFLEGKIPIEYEILVPFIKGREGRGICPMERLVEDTVDIEEGFKRLKEFLKV